MMFGSNVARHGRAHLLATTALAVLLLAVPAQAQEKREIAIPAEDATAAVPALGAQTGLQISAASEDLRGVRTNEVRGSYAPLDAVRKLVEGTSLQIVQTGDRAITLRRGTLVAAPVPALRPVAATQPLRVPIDTQAEEIVVTGSRIKRAGFDTLQAATVTDAREMERRGYTNVIDALQATPGFGAPGSSQLSASQGRMGIGQSFANFFGLGSQRTLTLVDGKRFVTSNSPSTGGNASPGSQVDLNLIPAGLVERIETVAIGGAPVYGSDAIAGTVNIILKKHYQGAEITAQGGLSDHGDARNKTVRAIYGTDFAGGRGNVVVAGEYNQQDGLLYSGRYDLRNLVANPANTSNSDGIPAQYYARNVRFAFMTEGGLPYRSSGTDIPGLNNNYIFDSAGRPLQFARDGSLVPFNVGQVVQASSGIPILASGGDGVNSADHFSLLTPTDRKLANLNAGYDITDNIRVYVQSSYAKSQATLLSDLTSIIAPNIVASPSLTISANNPFLNAQARSVLAANGVTSFRLARNLNDVVDRTPAQLSEELYRAVGGLEGKFGAWKGEQLSWNLSYNYGYTRNFSSDSYVDPARLQLAVNAVRDASGNIVCASGAAGCVPINLFGQDAMSPEAAAYVTNRGTGITKNYQSVITGNVSGNLPFSVGAPVAFNVGYEHRREASGFTPNYGFTIGDTLDGVPGYSPVSGSFNTNEFYGETVIPLVVPQNEIGFIKAASIESAVRYVDHSATGGATTWSTGARFSPRLPGFGDGLTIRGVYTHAIRSPAITELFLPASGSLNGITDPCDAANLASGPNPATRRANCAASLAAVGAPVPGSFRSTTRNVSVAGTQSGNPNLKNESADSWSVGLVYSPPAIPRFNLSLDYSNIELTDGIQLLAINTVLSTCFDSSNYPGNAACSQFRRLTAAQAAGTVRGAGDIAAGYTTGYFNTSALTYRGLIAAADYSFELRDIVASWRDAGSIGLQAKLVYTSNYDSVQFEGGPVTSSVGTIGLPKWKAQLGVNYTWHEFDAGVQVLWNSAVVSDKTATQEIISDYKIGSYTLVNGNLAWQFTPNLRAQLSVSNLFNTSMPEVAIATRSFSTYDPLGRRYLLRMSANF